MTAEARPAPEERSRRPYRSNLVYGFGAVTFILLVLVAGSGAYMAMFYQPSPVEAWKSVVFIEEKVRFGHFARSMHRWGAFIMMISVVLHILDCIWRGAYRSPRVFIWYSGIVLLLLTVCSVLTGYTLAWDFKSYWMVKTMTNWLESLPHCSGLLRWVLYTDAPNGMVPVGRWFAIHIMVLPVMGVIFLTAHYALFRRRGSAAAKP